MMYMFTLVQGWVVLRIIGNRVRTASRGVCLFAAVSAAESIEKGNLVDAGFFVNTLFSTIKTFAESMEVEMGPWSSTLKNVFRGDIEKVWEQRSAISKAVMNEKELRNQFSYHLYMLADRLLSTEGSSDYNTAHDSVQFFIAKTQKYWEPAGFLEKHKAIARSLEVVHDFMKITIVYVLLFILWLIFGFQR